MSDGPVKSSIVLAAADLTFDENGITVLLQSPDDGPHSRVSMSAEVALSLIRTLHVGVDGVMTTREAKGLPPGDLAELLQPSQLVGFDLAPSNDLATVLLLLRVKDHIETRLILPVEDLRAIRRSIERALKAVDRARKTAARRWH